MVDLKKDVYEAGRLRNEVLRKAQVERNQGYAAGAVYVVELGDAPTTYPETDVDEGAVKAEANAALDRIRAARGRLVTRYNELSDIEQKIRIELNRIDQVLG